MLEGGDRGHGGPQEQGIPRVSQPGSNLVVNESHSQVLWSVHLYQRWQLCGSPEHTRRISTRHRHGTGTGSAHMPPHTRLGPPCLRRCLAADASPSSAIFVASADSLDTASHAALLSALSAPSLPPPLPASAAKLRHVGCRSSAAAAHTGAAALHCGAADCRTASSARAREGADPARRRRLLHSRSDRCMIGGSCRCSGFESRGDFLPLEGTAATSARRRRRVGGTPSPREPS